MTDDTISRAAAIDALDVLCQEHRYRIPGKRETYSQYNEAWQDALDRAEGAIGNLPSAQPTGTNTIQVEDCIGRQAAIDALGEKPDGDDEWSLGCRSQWEWDTEILKTMPPAQPNLDEWCDDCKEYDKERHSCPRWNRVIRQTVEDMKAAQSGEDIKAMCGECDAWNRYKNYPQPGWIPVTEKLPKDDGDYLVTTHSGQIARYIFIGGSSEEYWRRCATAWMTLPTPYREGGQDENN